MIVRILHEGQFDIDGRDLDTINDLDNQLVSAVAAGNEQQFGVIFANLMKTVREHGKAVPIDQFVESDIILPAADSSMEDVQHLFVGEGLVPG